ncbi:MAG: leucine-rich repeat protein, partial [Clostridia bacterium]|nr:leucine-rich repeat protein [Clostridia bacterium]
MKKKIIIILCAVLMLATVAVPAFAAEFEAPKQKSVSGKTQTKADTKGTYENLEYEISGGSVTITGYVTEPTGALIKPETIEGYPVTTIGEAAFEECYSLTRLKMPSVRTIGTFAFDGCFNLTHIEMESVQTICHSAFNSCESLTDIEMFNVEDIDEMAFCDCEALMSVELFNTKTIGEAAFSFCDSLSSAYFYSDAPTSFGEGVFEGCADDFTIYYAEGTKGWDTPEWNGYPAYPFNPD